MYSCMSVPPDVLLNHLHTVHSIWMTWTLCNYIEVHTFLLSFLSLWRSSLSLWRSSLSSSLSLWRLSLSLWRSFLSLCRSSSSLWRSSLSLWRSSLSLCLSSLSLWRSLLFSLLALLSLSFLSYKREISNKLLFTSKSFIVKHNYHIKNVEANMLPDFKHYSF